MTLHEINRLRHKLRGLEAVSRILQIFIVILPIALAFSFNLAASLLSFGVLILILYFIHAQIARNTMALFNIFAQEVIWTTQRNPDIWDLLRENTSIQGEVRIDAETAKTIFSKMNGFSEPTVRDTLLFFDQVSLHVVGPYLSLSFASQTITRRIEGGIVDDTP